MKEQGSATWIEQRLSELERSIASWKNEMHRRRADGTEPDPEDLAKIQMWEKEFKGLKSLRDGRDLEEN